MTDGLGHRDLLWKGAGRKAHRRSGVVITDGVFRVLGPGNPILEILRS